MTDPLPATLTLGIQVGGTVTSLCWAGTSPLHATLGTSISVLVPLECCRNPTQSFTHQVLRLIAGTVAQLTLRPPAACS